MMFGSVSEHVSTLLPEIQCKNCGAECTISGNRTCKKFSLWTHPIYSIRPKNMFGSVSEHFTTLLHEIRCKTCVSSRMHNFGVPNVWKKLRYEHIQSTPINPNNVCAWFRAFAKLLHENRCKTCDLGQNANFRGTELLKKFRYERIQSTPLDPKRCLGVFRSKLQHFCTKFGAKLVVRGRMYNFWLPNLQKKFHYERFQSTSLDPKRCLGAFQSMSHHLWTKFSAKLVFLAKCSILRYRTSGKIFATNASNLLHWTQNDV